MYTYFLTKYDCVKLGKYLSKKCKVSFFAKYIIVRFVQTGLLFYGDVPVMQRRLPWFDSN